MKLTTYENLYAQMDVRVDWAWRIWIFGGIQKDL